MATTTRNQMAIQGRQRGEEGGGGERYNSKAEQGEGRHAKHKEEGNERQDNEEVELLGKENKEKSKSWPADKSNY